MRSRRRVYNIAVIQPIQIRGTKKEMMTKKTALLTLFGALLAILILVACGGSTDDSKTLDIERPAAPAPYTGRTNPLAKDTAAIKAGKKLYATNCASCHGPEAMGDGPAANSLNPRPKPLAAEMKALQDDYLFWRVSEGGAFSPFASAMPAWKTILSEDEIWQVIAFLRTLAK
jgi:mono/diheme cytochrome c family protein